MNFAVDREPNGHSGGVMDAFAVQGDLQAAVGFYVVVNFDVGGVPDVLFVGNFFGEGFDSVPVVLLVEFVGVTPDVEEVGMPAVVLEGEKTVC